MHNVFYLDKIIIMIRFQSISDRKLSIFLNVCDTIQVYQITSQYHVKNIIGCIIFYTFRSCFFLKLDCIDDLGLLKS